MSPLDTVDVATKREQLERAWSVRKSDPSLAREGAQALQHDPDVSLLARALLSFLDGADGQMAALVQPALETAAALRDRGERLWLYRALGPIASAYQQLGQRDLALEAFHEMLELARDLDDAYLQGVVLGDVGVLWYLSDRDKAAEYFRAAIDVLKDAGPIAQASLANVCVNLGGLEYQAGRREEGVALIERGRDLAHAAQAIVTWVNATCYMAEVHTERGDVATARAELQHALAAAPDMPGVAKLIVLRTAGIVEHLAGQWRRALDAFEQYKDFELGEFDRRHLLEMKSECHAKLGEFERAYEVSQELVKLNEQIHKRERETQLLKLEEKHQAETARREANVRRLEAEAAKREADMKHLENVELQRALESNAILIGSLRESQLVSETLLGVSHLMQLDLEPLDLARHALALVTRVVDADWCALARVQSDDVTFEPVWARGAEAEAFARAVLPSVSGARRALLGRSAWHDEPTFQSGYDRAEDALPALVSAGLRDVASLPVGDASGASYVLLLGRLHRDARWTERERRVLGAAARSLRAAVEIHERNRRAREASLTDALTGLENRRAFEAHAQEAVRGAAFSVAMLDLDGLKQVNDARGHAAGDTLLQVFASTLKANAPRNVHAFRLGGDEFALLIEHDDRATAESVHADVLEVVDAAVAGARTAGFSDAGCSFGVARWPHDGAAPADVVATADARLYDDKRARKTRGVPTATRDVSIGDVALDAARRELRGPLGTVKLSPTEAAVLRALMGRAPHLVVRADLAAAANLVNGEAGGTLDVHVSNVRRKLAGVTQRAGIRTVRGQGFSWQWVDAPSE